jgi:hypothetical protein
MPDAIDQLIADLEQQKISVRPEPIIVPVADFIAALQEIQGSLVPVTVENANTFYAGPVAGLPALPTFRDIVSADLPIATTAAVGAVKPDGATITINGAGEIMAPGGGSGTVTSVALTMPSIFAVAGSPITTNGTLAVTLDTQADNLVFAGPASGGAAVPTFRSLVAADLPLATLSLFGAVKPDGTTISISGGVLSAVDTGTVTSVGLALGGGIYTISGSPVTTTGTLTGTLANQNPNLFFAGAATGGAAAPTFRAIAAADLPLATVSAFGAVKPDGSSITISGGVISAPGGGSGTVTSVALALPSIFTVSGSPITTTGTLTGTLNTQNANLVFAGPSSGGAAGPTFRALVAADLPSGTTPTGANPTATAGPTAVNGSAATFMRSDAAPAVQKASSSQFGIVEVDGITIAAAAGVISVGTIGTVASSSTPTPGAVTQFNVTALAVGATIGAPTGSPADGQKLIIRITDNGSVQTLAWNATYHVITGITLPTATLGSTTASLYVGCIYNAQQGWWDVVAAS